MALRLMVGFLLTAKRDLAAARRFFDRAINLHDLPVSITIDKHEANMAAINSVIADTGASVLPRHSKYLNNRVERDRRAVKRITDRCCGDRPFGARRGSSRGSRPCT